MKKLRMCQKTACGLAILGMAVLSGPYWFTTAAQSGHKLLGGPRGVVRSAKNIKPLTGTGFQGGEPLEGIGVQLISLKTAIRTTVYSDEEGRYEFPKLDSGFYPLRITRPLDYRPYQRESIPIDGATQLQDIVLERVSKNEFLPPTSEILPQLTDAEWMLNLPGTGQEKRVFNISCGFGCHSYQQVFSNRYDEESWRLIIDRMLSGNSTLIWVNPPSNTAEAREQIPMRSAPAVEILTKWLATVRGPEAKDDSPLYVLPRSKGAATRMIVTEYELPRTLLVPHDVHGDSKGNIWYTAHRSPYVGALNPRTGEVKEYRLPDDPAMLPGTHRVWVDQKDYVWFSENWRSNMVGLDPETGEFKVFPLEPRGFSNFAMDSKGLAYETLDDGVVQIDSKTGKIVKKFTLNRVRSTYDSIVSHDDRYWSGGTTSGNMLGLLDTQTGEWWETEIPTLNANPSRGGFDRDGNAWFGGRGGMLLKLDTKTRRVTEYWPPIPYVTFYEAMPDKNGEVWAAALGSGRFLRFKPRSERWIQYMLPEPYCHDRRTWIDNSTDPVTVWYVDHNGYLVRLQPLE